MRDPIMNYWFNFPVLIKNMYFRNNYRIDSIIRADLITLLILMHFTVIKQLYHVGKII